jgi:hypothetical protein
MDHGWVMVHGVLSRKQEAAHSGTFLLENSLMLLKTGEHIFEIAKGLLCDYIMLRNIAEL